jgi:hypothetical protein
MQNIMLSGIQKQLAKTMRFRIRSAHGLIVNAVGGGSFYH